MSSIAPPARDAASSRRVTREDIVQAGQGGSPWEFVPLALAALCMSIALALPAGAQAKLTAPAKKFLADQQTLQQQFGAGQEQQMLAVIAAKRKDFGSCAVFRRLPNDRRTTIPPADSTTPTRWRIGPSGIRHVRRTIWATRSGDPTSSTST